MQQYLDLVRDIMVRGKVKHPPQGVDAISLAGACMHFDLDGSFPNHQPDPLVKANLKSLQEKVLKEIWEKDIYMQSMRCRWIDRQKSMKYCLLSL